MFNNKVIQEYQEDQNDNNRLELNVGFKQLIKDHTLVITDGEFHF